MPEPAPQLDDQQLWQSYCAGDHAALLALLDRYELPLFHFLLGLLRDRHTAEDVLQETFCQAFQKAHTITGESLRGWLFTVAHQQALLWKRKHRRLPLTNMVPAERSPEDPGIAHCPDPVSTELEPWLKAAQHDDERLLQQWIQQLSPNEQTLIQMRIYDGLRFREIAEQQGWFLNTTLSRMHEAIKKLRLYWEQHHAGLE